MKIAVCLYGQPRDYKYGHECIANFIKDNNEHSYEFFFHCWIDDNIKYETSPWRRIDEKTLVIKNQDPVKCDINQLYKPVSHLYEKPLDRHAVSDLIEHIKKSKAYLNSNRLKRANVYNTLSQIYSRNKVRDLFEEYVERTKTTYDLVISTRFDGFGFYFQNKIDISNVKPEIYKLSVHKPRYIIPDNFLIIPPKIYINWFNLYKNIKYLINSEEIEQKMARIDENFEFNMEEMLLSSYLFCGYDINNINYI